jgi:hypothetical protein
VLGRIADHPVNRVAEPPPWSIKPTTAPHAATGRLPLPLEPASCCRGGWLAQGQAEWRAPGIGRDMPLSACLAAIRRVRAERRFPLSPGQTCCP